MVIHGATKSAWLDRILCRIFSRSLVFELDSAQLLQVAANKLIRLLCTIVMQFEGQ